MVSSISFILVHIDMEKYNFIVSPSYQVPAFLCACIPEHLGATLCYRLQATMLQAQWALAIVRFFQESQGIVGLSYLQYISAQCKVE